MILLYFPWIFAVLSKQDGRNIMKTESIKGSRCLPIRLVKHHVLHILQFEVHFHDDVHQTTRSTNDAGEIQGRMFCSLPFNLNPDG